MTARTWSRTAVTILVALALGCTAQLGRREGAPAAAAPERGGRLSSIEHLTPPRDSIGAVPPRFAWTPFEGADAYAIGIWSEVDVLLWRADDVRGPSVAPPVDLRLEPGTYFWSVTALREKQAVAESGRAAFIVR